MYYKLSGAIQTNKTFISIEQIKNNKIKYTIWHNVVNHFSNTAHPNSIYISQEGLTNDSFDELKERFKPKNNLNLYYFKGKNTEYPYSPSYNGPTKEKYSKLITVELI